MAESVQVEGFDAFGRAAKAAPKELQKQVRKALRDATKPLGRTVITEGLQAMPGSIPDHYARATGRAVPSSGWAGVQLALGGARKKNLDILNRGMIRHPLFGRTKTTDGRSLWFMNNVPANTFTDAAQHHLPELSQAVTGALEATLDTMETK